MTVWLGIIGGILGVAGALGSAFAVMRAGMTARTIELWKEQAGALEARLKEEQTERAECEAKLLIRDMRIEKLESFQEFVTMLLGNSIDAKAIRNAIQEKL